MPDLIFKQWVAVIDARTTIVCLNAAGQVRAVTKPFDTLNGEFDEPPAHIHCRAMVVPFLAGAVNTQRDLANVELQSRPVKYRDPRKMSLPPRPYVTRAKQMPGVKTAQARKPKRPAQPAGPRPGMGDIPIGPGKAAEMAGGSGEKFLIKNRDGSYRFTAGRQRLHDRIVEETLAGKTAVEKPAYNMLGGGGGSGKTTLVNSKRVQLLNDPNTVAVNVDEVRTNLPEYIRLNRRGDKAAAAFTHEESSHIAGRVQAAAFERRLNVMLDGTGDGAPAKLGLKVKAARDAGYSVHGTYVTIPTDTAVARAEARGARTGRYVPEAVLRKVHGDVSRTYREAYTMFDTSEVWDMVSREPKLLATWDGRKLKIIDRQGWKDFLGKGDE